MSYNYISINQTLIEQGLGAIEIQTLKYSDGTEELRRVITIYSYCKGSNGWGDIIFKGTLKELIGRLEWQGVTA